MPRLSTNVWLIQWWCWLVVFNVPSTARSFRDGTPIYCPLRRTWSSINTPFRPGIEPRGMAVHYVTAALRKLHFSGDIRYITLLTPHKPPDCCGILGPLNEAMVTSWTWYYVAPNFKIVVPTINRNWIYCFMPTLHLSMSPKSFEYCMW